MAEGALLPPLVLRLAAPVLWTALLLVPVPGWGRLDGVPLGPIETAALVAVWWAWAAAGALPGKHWAPVVLLALKIATGALLVPHGLDAAYFANAAWRPPHESSLARAGDAPTRRDPVLRFGGAEPDLPLHFFHDNRRFNVATTAGRLGLPFSVEWQAHWRVDEAREVTLYATGPHLSAQVVLDGRVALDKPVDADDATASTQVAEGWRRVTVRVSAPAGLARAFEAGVIADGERRPFGTSDVYPSAPGLSAREWNARARMIAAGVDLVALAWLFGSAVLVVVRMWRDVMARGAAMASAWPARTALSLAAAIACADALFAAIPVHGRVALLLGGDDMLTYATQARDILFNGFLMTGGLPVGQAEPFYYQPLYPYVLALTHVVFGEDTFGIVFLQRLGMWVAALAAWRIAARLFGSREAVATLAVAVVFALAALAPWTTVLLGEAVFVPLVMASAWTLVVVSQGAGAGGGVAAGVVAGLATLSRSTLLPAWAFVVLLAAVARQRRALSLAPLVPLVAALALVVGTATLRNWIVSGQIVPIATSFPVNFELGNPPPPDLAAHDVFSHPWLAALPVDPRTARVIDGAWHAPGAFVAGLGRKAIYVFGAFEPHMPGRGWSPWLMASSLLGLTGLLLAWRRGRGAPERWLPAALALSHFAAVTLIFPHAHGDRMILPFHALLLPYAGLAVAALRRPRYD